MFNESDYEHVNTLSVFKKFPDSLLTDKSNYDIRALCECNDCRLDRLHIGCETEYFRFLELYVHFMPCLAYLTTSDCRKIRLYFYPFNIGTEENWVDVMDTDVRSVSLRFTRRKYGKSAGRYFPISWTAAVTGKKLVELGGEFFSMEKLDRMECSAEREWAGMNDEYPSTWLIESDDDAREFDEWKREAFE